MAISKDNIEPPGNVVALIVAAGRGTRAGSEAGPKQYQKLGDTCVLDVTISAFAAHPGIDKILVVIHAEDREMYKANTQAHSKLLPPALGGATRQQSVFCGLEALKDHGASRVLIHDAARPFVAPTLIDRVLSGLDDSAAALPALAVADTLKSANADGLVEHTVPRDGLYSAQTPQGFHFLEILSAHEKAASHEKHDFTDDSALAEWADMPVQIVEGDRANNKITTQNDMIEAQRKMSQSPSTQQPLPDVRVGHGYDTHQIVENKELWLCGIKLDHSHGLSGHSDADVGLHALTDALLATIADGDIGSHFPPSDDKWKGARSDQFLKHAVDLVVKAGGTITHMDVTLLCEAPKIGPHRQAMRQAMSDICGIDVSRISVKATTNERIGFIGREEGMVALATATVVLGTL